MRYTPGPWGIYQNEYLLGNVNGNNQICKIKWLATHKHQKEANARLIAQAPAMLEALKACQKTIDEMLAVIGDHCEPWSSDHQKQWQKFCNTFDKIGEVIEAAEGGE